MHIFLAAVRSEASVGSISHAGVVDEPVVLPIAPAVVHVAVHVAEVPVVMSIEIRLETVGGEGEEVIVRLIVCRATGSPHTNNARNDRSKSSENSEQIHAALDQRRQYGAR